MLVLEVVWAVGTTVYAVVGQIKGGKDYNTVAVKVLFYLTGKVIHTLYSFGVFTGEKNRGFSVVKPFFQLSLVQNFINKFKIILVFVGIIKSVKYFFVGYKFLRFK